MNIDTRHTNKAYICVCIYNIYIEREAETQRIAAALVRFAGGMRRRPDELLGYAFPVACQTYYGVNNHAIYTYVCIHATQIYIYIYIYYIYIYTGSNTLCCLV